MTAMLLHCQRTEILLAALRGLQPRMQRLQIRQRLRRLRMLVGRLGLGRRWLLDMDPLGLGLGLLMKAG